MLIRHGQTVWNEQRKYQGQLDSGLTERGRHQAVSVGRVLASRACVRGIRAFYASPIGRALYTAAIIAHAIGVPTDSIVTSDLLKECHFGCWQGLDRSEVKARYPREMKIRKANRVTYRIPGGECYADLRVRARRWIGGLPSEGLILCVAHELINRAIRGELLGLDPEEAARFRQHHHRVIEITGGRERILTCDEALMCVESRVSQWL